MSQRKTKSKKASSHRPTPDNLALFDLGSTKDEMLGYYLDEGQPAFTDRLVHGQPATKKARTKKLKKTLKDIEKVLGTASTANAVSSIEAMATSAAADQTAVVRDRASQV